MLNGGWGGGGTKKQQLGNNFAVLHVVLVEWLSIEQGN